MIQRIKVLAFLLLLFNCARSQMSDYTYKRELKGITGQWHSLMLPDEIYGKMASDLRDLRIYGITTENDTVEAPYILRIAQEQTSNRKIAFKILNESFADGRHYFTFEIPENEPINEIKLDFKQQNFDWRVRLEGSQNQIEWFTLSDDYRIISIKNTRTDFQFTTLTFPDAKYRFYRVSVMSKEKPALITAIITRNETKKGVYRNYPAREFTAAENKNTTQTGIEVALPMPVPISRIKIHVRDTFDYYRPVTIDYPADSTKTEQGWIYHYRTLATGILASVNTGEFGFNSTTLKKLRIRIFNQNNPPLTVDSVQVSGYTHELIIRFTEKAHYFLVYGNGNVTPADYDITHFSDKIPAMLTALTLGKKQLIEKGNLQTTMPLFQNKMWLWGIMIIIILLLGWFSVAMMKRR